MRANRLACAFFHHQLENFGLLPRPGLTLKLKTILGRFCGLQMLALFRVYRHML